MIRRILLVQPPYTFEKDIPLIVEMPLGLCYIASVLRKKGFEVQILDALAEGYKNTKYVDRNRVLVGLDDNRIKKKVKKFKPDVVGVSCLFTVQYENAKRMLKIVKSYDKKVLTVMGGMHPTVCTKEVLEDENLDYVIRGEGEYSFLELLKNLNKQSDISYIDGLGWKKDGKIFVNEKEKFIENLDELPFPARDLLKIENYFKANLAHGFFLKGKRNINIITSRGCPGRCIFCTVNLLWGRKFRGRSPDNMIEELKAIKQNYKADHIQFEDDNLTFDIERAKTLFRKMVNLNLKWNTPNGVAAWRLDEETLDLMKKSGCYYVKFAVESGNQRVLANIIKKPQDLDKVTKLIHYSRKIGLKVGSFFVIGLPGETKKEMQDSFDFPKKVKLDWVEYSIATPHYGTELYKICKKKEYLKDFDTNKLYARRSIFATPEFSREWLEKKILLENRKYMAFLLLNQPKTIFTAAFELTKRNPFFVIKYLSNVFKST
jgi:magnesium-protoporphyrin IX monomethyl ester (oxidative) cyclase